MSVEEILGLFNVPGDRAALVSHADANEYVSIITYLLIRDAREGRNG